MVVHGLPMEFTIKQQHQIVLQQKNIITMQQFQLQVLEIKLIIVEQHIRAQRTTSTFGQMLAMLIVTAIVVIQEPFQVRHMFGQMTVTKFATTPVVLIHEQCLLQHINIQMTVMHLVTTLAALIQEQFLLQYINLQTIAILLAIIVDALIQEQLLTVMHGNKPQVMEPIIIFKHALSVV